MKKNDIFTFTAPNGVEVTAVAINKLSYRVIAGDATTTWICYAQNRLFTYKMIQNLWDKSKSIEYHYGEVLVDYAILPDYDELLKVHKSMDYPLWEQNFEKEIQGLNDR